VKILRAKRPDTFKTAGVNVNVGIKQDVFVLTEEARHELMDTHKELLADLRELKKLRCQNDTAGNQVITPIAVSPIIDATLVDDGTTTTTNGERA
jgi:predicted RNA-binding protein (virulence factor B family)